jgi:hypothetical protein
MSKLASFLIVTVATISVIKFGNSPDPLTAIAQPGCVIKGNVSWNADKKLYHVPGMQDYEATIINGQKGEKWFCTESEAIASGWIRAPK